MSRLLATVPSSALTQQYPGSSLHWVVFSAAGVPEAEARHGVGLNCIAAPPTCKARCCRPIDRAAGTWRLNRIRRTPRSITSHN